MLSLAPFSAAAFSMAYSPDTFDAEVSRQVLPILTGKPANKVPGVVSSNWEIALLVQALDDVEIGPRASTTLDGQGWTFGGQAWQA